jgi:hypothetical protein
MNDYIECLKRSGPPADREGRLGHLGEEVVALVIDHDERREVLDLDLPDRLHPELGVLEHLDLADVFLRQDRGGAADRAEAERFPLASITFEPPAAWKAST